MRTLAASGLIMVFCTCPSAFIAPGDSPRRVSDERAEIAAEQVKGPGDILPADVIKVLSAPAFRHIGAVQRVGSTQDEKHLVTASEKGGFLWDAASGSLIKQFLARPVYDLAVSANGQVMAAAGRGGIISVWRVANASFQSAIDVKLSEFENVRALAISPDGTTIASAVNDDAATRLWNSSTAQSTGKLMGHTGNVVALRFHPSGKSLISASLDGSVREWQMASGRETKILIDRPDWWIESISLSSNGRSLAIITRGNGLQPGRIRIFEFGTLEQRFVASVPGASGPHEVVLSPDGRHAAASFRNWQSGTAELDGNPVLLWDTFCAKRIALRTENGHFGLGLSFMNNGGTLASGGTDGVVRLWTLSAGGESPLTKGPAGCYKELVFSPSGTSLGTLNEYGTIHIWNTETGHRLNFFQEHKLHPTSLSLSADGKSLFYHTPPYANAGRNTWGYHFDAYTGESLPALASLLQSIPVNPSGRTPDGFGRFDFIKNAFGQAFQRDSPPLAALSPDGRYVAAANLDTSLHFWDARTGKRESDLKGHQAVVSALAFSPDGELLVSADAEDQLSLWHPARGIRLWTLQLAAGFTEHAWLSHDNSLIFALRKRTSPDGKSSSDLSIEVIDATGHFLTSFHLESGKPKTGWLTPRSGSLVLDIGPGKFSEFDLIRGEPIGPHLEYGGDYCASAFSPDGKMLALGYPDGRLLLSKPPPLPQYAPIATEVAEIQLGNLWDSLGADAKTAYQARWQLIAARKQALQIFKKALQPIKPMDEKQISTWIAQLDSNTFKEREAAMRELNKIGPTAESLLTAALKKSPPLEMKQRIENLLGRIAGPAAGDTLVTLRAIVVLESIGNAEAVTILRELAAGAEKARVTEAAKATLKRLSVTVPKN